MNATETTTSAPHLTPLLGRIVGFVDTEEQLENVLQALQRVRFARSKITVFRGESGLNAVEELKHEIHMGEDERELVSFCSSELKEGHIGIEVEVQNQTEARLVSETATSHQARHFTYFGPWYTMRCT